MKIFHEYRTHPTPFDPDEPSSYHSFLVTSTHNIALKFTEKMGLYGEVLDHPSNKGSITYKQHQFQFERLQHVIGSKHI